MINKNTQSILISELVSVIIRTRNRHGAVIKAVQSVLNQTWKNIEIVVVNDGLGKLDLPISNSIPIRVFETKNKANRSFAANVGSCRKFTFIA